VTCWMRRRTLVLVATLACGASDARALVGSTAGVGGVDGSVRTIAAAIDNYDFPLLLGDHPVDALSQTLLRLTLLGRPRGWLAYEVHGVQTVDYASSTAPSGTLPFSLVPGDVRYRALEATTTWHQRADHRATLFLDRANVTLALPWADVTVGRQAITFGKTYFWNPLDVFLAFDPRQFDRDYKPGVDALRVDVPLGAFAGVSVIGAAGRTLDAFGRFTDDGTLAATWFGSAVLGRAFATVRGWDVAVQGGKIYGGEHVGAGAVGEAGPLEVRAEVAHLFAAHGRPLLPGVLPRSERLVESGTTAVVGLGHRFESTLTLEGEYFHNGLGDAGNLEASLLRFASGGLLDLSEELLGVDVGYDLLPILVAHVGLIAALDDGSLQYQPRLTWSAADEVEVLAGAIVSSGDRPAAGAAGLPRLGSEFGTFPDVYYAEVKLYF
jgi:hypothetical protein